DFIVYEDGQLQQVSHLGTIDTPFDLALVLDTSGSTENDRQLMLDAVFKFLSKIGSNDRVAIIEFNSKVRLLSNFSNNVQEIEAPLNQLGTFFGNSGSSSVYDA